MMDTKNFRDLTPEEYKKQTQNHWNASPCGSNYSDEQFMSKEYFEGVEKHRYSSHPWIIENIRKFDIKGKKVLEIGFGMGTDHLALARQGGIMHGIDITPKNLVVTANRLELYGFKSDLITGDAENLPYEDNSFDFVYSFGVIHHSPDTEKIVSEIHRVLKPGGKCWITVYHKNSVFFIWSVFIYDWIFHGGFRKDTIKQRISRIEYPGDNPNLVIRLYKKHEFKSLFTNKFSKVNASIDHLIKEDITLFGSLFSQNILNAIGKKFGWYVIVDATK
jgi:ubiquinone/menaquinone biosynthesis C-methylase UbiE